MSCGGGGDDPSGTTPPPPPPPPPPPQGGFAGSYATRVSLTSSSCGAVVVQDNPTAVTHDVSSGAVSFTHAGQTYLGSVAADSTFATTPKGVNVNDGFVYTITLAGRFRRNAFDADATVDRSDQGSGTCRFVVHWEATK
jgi:hypothetical protein